MFEHLATILWLKSRFVRHSMTKATGILSVILIACVVTGVCFVAVGFSLGLFFLGVFGDLGEQDALPVLAISDGLVFFFCVIWLVSILAEVQRSDLIDMRKLMYLPVSLKSVFGINFAFSLLTPAGLLFVFPGMAFATGLAVRHGPLVLLGIPAVAVFYLCLAGWTYYVRGWLAVLMENRRRRRMLLMMLPMAFIAIGYGPQLLIHLGPRKLPADPRTLLAAVNVFLPPGWLPLALQSLVRGDALTALACTAGLAGLAVLPLSMGYRATRNHYLGLQSRRERKRKPEAALSPKHPIEDAFLARDLPGLDEETSAMALASFTMLSRHPVVRMQLIAPFLVAAILFTLYVVRTDGFPNLPAIVRNAIPTAALAWPLLNGSVFFANIFGADGNGFRSLILLPTPRRKYILGKNIAHAALFGVPTVLFAILAFAVVRPEPLALLIALINAVYALLLISACGNLISLYMPFKISSDSMRGAGNNPKAVLGAFLFLFLLPLVLGPPLLCAVIDGGLAHLYPGWWFPSGVLLAVVFAGLALLTYRKALVACERLLAAREPKILEAVTKGKD